MSSAFSPSDGPASASSLPSLAGAASTVSASSSSSAAAAFAPFDAAASGTLVEITSSPELTFERPSANAKRLSMSPDAPNVIIDTLVPPPTDAFARKILMAHFGERRKSSVFGTSLTSPVSKFFCVPSPWSSAIVQPPLSPRIEVKSRSPVVRMRIWFAAPMRGIT